MKRATKECIKTHRSSNCLHAARTSQGQTSLTVIIELDNKDTCVRSSRRKGSERPWSQWTQTKLDYQKGAKIETAYLSNWHAFKKAFNSIGKILSWAVLQAYTITDVDVLEVIYGRMTVRMNHNDVLCSTITFLTGVLEGGASFPRFSIIFRNSPLKHFNILHTREKHSGQAMLGLKRTSSATSFLWSMPRLLPKTRQKRRSLWWLFIDRNVKIGAIWDSNWLK